ncbi:hypothetical protein L1049_018507 [Liquidambar formosana]|uniref:TF-B3 domain-containing protein n=1 Tax=Liquidambar formosana TaxID=63359 RepID=A0AAP0WLT2_LIQFO
MGDENTFTSSLQIYFHVWLQFLPKPFTRSNGLSKGCCKMVLIDQKQRLWPVKLGRKKSDNRVYIRSGWHEFRVANGLKEGDAFIFELIKKCKTPIMKFHRKFWLTNKVHKVRLFIYLFYFHFHLNKNF